MMLRTLPISAELPRALYTAEQVAGFDRLAIERFGVPGATLMERAGKAAFDLVRQRWPAARRLSVLAGVGNNAGDGFVLARLAHEAGLAVRVLQLGDRERLHGDAADNAMQWQALGGDWQPYREIPQETDLLVDAVFGTGLERPVSGAWADAIHAANRHPAPCLAIDLPSGLHADNGVVMGCAIHAAATITFIGLKIGLFTADGPDCAGEVVFDGLDVPAAVYASSVLSARRIDWHKQRERLQPRRRNSHKGHFGHVLVIGGNQGLGGAVRMAAQAALRVGAGLVSIATRGEHVAPVLAALPEAMPHAVGMDTDLQPLLQRASVIAIGPGLGRDAWADRLWQAALAAGRPLVVDADALHLLQRDGLHRDDWILTPHPGEAAAMLGRRADQVQAQRMQSVVELQRRFGGSVILKGVGTLVTTDGPTPPALCSAGNPGMASGGMGDVLTGVIAGLLAQGLELRDAAESAVCLHAAAGDRAAEVGERGLLASDLIAQLRTLANPS